MAITEASVVCPECGWWRHDDGTCRRCEARRERGLRGGISAPPIADWPPALKRDVFDRLALRATQFGSEAERRQASMELWLRAGAADLGLIPRNGPPVPIRDVFDRYLKHLNLPVDTPSAGSTH